MTLRSPVRRESAQSISRYVFGFWLLENCGVENGNESLRRNVSFEMMTDLPTVELRFNKRPQFVFALMMFLMAAFYIWMPNSRRVHISVYVRWVVFVYGAAVGMFFLVSALFSKSYIKFMPHALELCVFFRKRQLR
jgi:lipopolysaccharide export LptBFGC system permease protein LptF